METTLKTAKALLADETLTEADQQKIDTAADALQKAMEGLVKADTKTPTDRRQHRNCPELHDLLALLRGDFPAHRSGEKAQSVLSGFLRQDEATRLNLLSNPQSVSGFAGDGLWIFVHFLAPLHPLFSPEFRYSTLYVLGKPPQTLDTIPFPRYHIPKQPIGHKDILHTWQKACRYVRPCARCFIFYRNGGIE